jgi:hypothetical protein
VYDRERVVERLQGFSPVRWAENEANSLALVFDLDAELVFLISAIPEQVDDDAVGLSMSEMIGPGQHVAISSAPSISPFHAARQSPPGCSALAAAAAP